MSNETIPDLTCWTCEKCGRAGAARKPSHKNWKDTIDDQHRERSPRCSAEPRIWPDISMDVLPVMVEARKALKRVDDVRRLLNGE